MVIFWLLGCGTAEIQRLEAENLSLREELAQVEAGRDECVNGADRLLQRAQARSLAGEWSEVLALSQQLADLHPGTQQALTGAELAVGARASIEREKEEAERDAEDARIALEQDLKEATAAMSSRHDDMRGVTWYRHRQSPEATSSRSALYFYFGKDDNGVFPLRLKAQYAGEDWLFVDEIIVRVDDETFTFESKGERDHSGGWVWEWDDRTARDWSAGIGPALRDAETVKVRFSGRTSYADVVLKPADVRAFHETWLAHEAMKAVSSE